MLHKTDKSVPFEEPVAQPWQHSCRVCLSNEERPEQGVLVLCDCCDAEYHTACLNPPLPAAPEDLWQCPRYVLTYASAYLYLCMYLCTYLYTVVQVLVLMHALLSCMRSIQS